MCECWPDTVDTVGTVGILLVCVGSSEPTECDTCSKPGQNNEKRPFMNLRSCEAPGTHWGLGCRAMLGHLFVRHAAQYFTQIVVDSIPTVSSKISKIQKLEPG